MSGDGIVPEALEGKEDGDDIHLGKASLKVRSAASIASNNYAERRLERRRPSGCSGRGIVQRL
jgi:hypothetical protein